jgi:restriction system protein
MKWQMHENSIFAVLLRSPWWVSALAATGIFVALRFVIPDFYAAFSALPFWVIAAVAGWRQLRTPSAGRVESTLQRLHALPREGFADALEARWRRDGYEVVRSRGGPIDLELRRAGKLSLVACRRWKAERTGVEPLRELHAAGRAREAHELIYIAAGEVTEQARAFAGEKRVRLVEGAELAMLLG